MGPDGYQLVRLSGIDTGRTQRLVERLGRMYGAHPLMRAFVARFVVGDVPDHDRAALARAIHAWVRDRIRFIEEAGEQILTPGRVLIWGFGDCDDKTGLFGAMCEAVNLPWRTALLADSSGTPYHIYPEVQVDGAWRPAEVSHRSAAFGEHPTAIERRLSHVF